VMAVTSNGAARKFIRLLFSLYGSEPPADECCSS
jgi:hypothetical protein